MYFILSYNQINSYVCVLSKHCAENRSWDKQDRHDRCAICLIRMLSRCFVFTPITLDESNLNKMGNCNMHVYHILYPLQVPVFIDLCCGKRRKQQCSLRASASPESDDCIAILCILGLPLSASSPNKLCLLRYLYIHYSRLCMLSNITYTVFHWYELVIWHYK